MLEWMTMQVTQSRRRGRPPSMSKDERRRRIIAAAEQTFTTRGYATASMDDVVLACGMSKKTVYELFSTKEQLFNDLIAAALTDVPSLHLDPAALPGGEAALREVLRVMAVFILSPRQVALARLVLTESPASPELGIIYYEKAMVRGRSLLVEAIRRIGGLGPAGGTPPEELADLLVGSLVGHWLFSTMIGKDPSPSEDEIGEKIDGLLKLLRPTLGLTDAPEADSHSPLGNA